MAVQKKPVMELVHNLALALTLRHPQDRPDIIFAGNSDMRSEAVAVLGSLSRIKPVDNIQPRLEVSQIAPLQTELETRYLHNKSQNLPGFSQLLEWADGLFTATAKSFAQTIHYLGQSYQVKVIGVDVGSTNVNIATSRDEIPDNYNAMYSGLGYGLPNLLKTVGLARFKRWLPFEISDVRFKNFLYNKSIYPHTIPQTYRQAILEYTVLQESIRQTWLKTRPHWPQDFEGQQWYHWDLIIGSGLALSQPSQTQLSHLALSVMALLNGLEPVGLCSLALDTQGLHPILGHIAKINPQAAVQLAQPQTLTTLGVLIAPIGLDLPKNVVLKIKITYQDGREETEKINFGTLQVFSLPVGETATVEIQPTRDFDLQPSGETAGKKVIATVEGGLLGIIVDTRGRPLVLATGEQERQQQIASWFEALGLNQALYAEFEPASVL